MFSDHIMFGDNNHWKDFVDVQKKIAIESNRFLSLRLRELIQSEVTLKVWRFGRLVAVEDHIKTRLSSHIYETQYD